MAIGNSIVTRAGPRLFVKSIKWNRRTEGYTVYNFETEALSGQEVDGRNTHSYFVGKTSGGAWVHNGDCEEVAEQIAGGHAFGKHQLYRNEFEGMGIRTRKQFGEYVDNVMTNASGSNVKPLANGRTAYWDPEFETVVIHNPNAQDKGTAFRPVAGKDYFDGL